MGSNLPGLSELLGKSDFISMHLPATPEAVGFLKEHHFRQMKKTAIFINTGRGPTVVEISADQGVAGWGWIAGAGLDVLPGGAGEGATIRWIKMPHVILSPHNASASARFERGTQAPRRPGAGAGAFGAMADVVRQPDGAAAKRPAPVAAGVDGARAEFVT